MSSNSTDDVCAPDDTLCIVREHQQAVIIVPTLLLFSTLVTLLALLGIALSRHYSVRNRARTTATTRTHHRSTHRRSQRHRQRRQLQGIDAPHGLNPLEHEELPMSVQPVQRNVKPTTAAVQRTTTERRHGAFSHVTALPLSFSIKPNETVSLHRARMDHRDVVLRVLKDSASNSEKQTFLGFASFLSGLGPHPFIPALVGVVSVQSPLVVAVEELQHRDLLGFLWRCRQVNSESGCDMTEKRIFTMARQVASALEYLHSQGCIHGNVAARSVLVGGDLTAKLWGLGSAYRWRTQPGSPGEVEVMELRKWQAPELLARTTVGRSSDIWSFGILLYEMVTLGDPPFSELMATELLQYLQRGKHLKRPANCSNSLYSLMRSCCQWSPPQRLSMSELIRKLQAGEKSANGRTVLRVPEPIDIEKYLREAGYGEAYNYAVL
ncbi:tyrosine-protein kinase STYK1 [Sphaeramia orbicularis]|uniref:Tyrosine-protein kinase STYK1-like n=1 Tax=Sphaeramia orbicularis TaxID=375764 RepID=A0A672YSU7_9TELE|nr:tyrosine-protein kinase STYK1-like [Sphaeramia orbicularis]XP_029986410.1 tyrosine-protein kinase STYK1-like [Sphaeramia orbicularis]XP_029986411.1 tyrosine-protein kinase STYK1-like [Sphaeramia orbicularis]